MKTNIKLLAPAILAVISLQSAAKDKYTYLNGMEIKINNNSAKITTNNKKPVIILNEKDRHGNSHIQYDEFNVGKIGLLFDNKINANIIINEVISDSPTKISGEIAIKGRKAELLVVNPNGISCSACSFTNTSHTYLIAGKTKKNEDITDPELNDYESKGKKITIKNMRSESEGELSLISRNIEIKNSNIKLKNLNLRTITSSYGTGYNHSSSISLDKKTVISADDIMIHAVNGKIINNAVLSGNTSANLKNISLKNNGSISGESLHAYLSGDINIDGSSLISFKDKNITDANENNVFWGGGETIIN